jgi:exopolyphosphatase/guanosine-5'-triphosphate,3'-diphosphate pyrophosphatase
MTPDHTPVSELRRVPTPARAGTRRHAVVDIGSNSIRLVVFDGVCRAPFAIFNEKVLCGLGRGMARSGRLDRDGMTLALANLDRFARLIEAMAVAEVDAVATAAVREAADGAEFVGQVRSRCGLEVRVLSGADEAELSALGVLSGIPEADGVIGDLGGGSLELVQVTAGAVGAHATLPLGPLALHERAGADAASAKALIDEAIAGLRWLREVPGRPLYLVGGSWRALARIHMARHDYPLRVIHRFRLRRAEIIALSEVVARQSRDSLSDMEEVPRRRLDVLPLASLVLDRLLKASAAKEVVFSAYGLREGLAYARLPATSRREDSLISACREVAGRAARFPEHGAELVHWTRELFPDEAPQATRLRHAACLLSDISWRAHPDYRAEHAFMEVLRHPGLHLDHHERAFLALAVFGRYTSREAPALVARVARLVEPEAAARAQVIGLAARLGETISGGVPGLVDRFALKVDGERGILKLRYSRRDERLIGEVVVRRLETLARAMDLAPELEVRNG